MDKETCNNRGARLSAKDQDYLKTRCRGFCEFEGCGEQLFQSPDGQTTNLSQMAHIIASSPNGPRGCEASHELADDPNNIIMVCHKHHKMIDAHPELYPVDRLLEMVDKHQQKLNCFAQSLKAPTILPIALTSPINRQNVQIDNSQILEALHPDFSPSQMRPHTIKLNGGSSFSYNSEDYWNYQEDELSIQLTRLKESLDGIQRCALFPLAPIPIIAKAGSILGDKIEIEIFQKQRNSDHWRWNPNSESALFSVKEEPGDVNGQYVALVLEVSDNIVSDRVINSCQTPLAFVRVQAESPSMNLIQSKNDLHKFVLKYLAALNLINKRYPGKPVYVFPAIPVSVAFEIGRRRIAAHPILTIFNAGEGSLFYKTVNIGDENAN